MLSPEPKALCWISGKMHKFLRFLADFLSALAFLCYHHILTHMPLVWLLALPLCLCTSIHMNFWCNYSLEQYLFQLHTNFFLSQARCSLEPKFFCRELHPLNLLLRGSECPPDPPAPLMLAICLSFIWSCSQLAFLIYILDKIKRHGTNLFSQEK